MLNVARKKKKSMQKNDCSTLILTVWNDTFLRALKLQYVIMTASGWNGYCSPKESCFSHFLYRLKVYMGCQIEDWQHEQAQLMVETDKPYTVSWWVDLSVFWLGLSRWRNFPFGNFEWLNSAVLPHIYIYIYIYIQTPFQKSWDTVQIVNKNRMQWCGSFKFQYFIQNTT